MNPEIPNTFTSMYLQSGETIFLFPYTSEKMLLPYIKLGLGQGGAILRDDRELSAYGGMGDDNSPSLPQFDIWLSPTVTEDFLGITKSIRSHWQWTKVNGQLSS